VYEVISSEDDDDENNECNSSPSETFYEYSTMQWHVDYHSWFSVRLIKELEGPNPRVYEIGTPEDPDYIDDNGIGRPYPVSADGLERTEYIVVLEYLATDDNIGLGKNQLNTPLTNGNIQPDLVVRIRVSDVFYAENTGHMTCTSECKVVSLITPLYDKILPKYRDERIAIHSGYNVPKGFKPKKK
jgi:hypothetical protein